MDGGTGTNTLNVAGSVTLTGSENDGSEVGYAGTNGNLGTSGFVGISVLNDTNATPDALSGESGAYGTWTVGESSSDTSTYADNTGTGVSLTFSGFSTLNAGAGDTFNLTTDPSTGFTINGGAGTDTLTGVFNPVLSSSSGSGFSGTADNTISFTAIDVLDGTGSLSGENAASTWTVYASSDSSTYYDGSSTLTFSGFNTLDAGTGGDTFNVQSGASGYTFNGGTGTDTLTGVADVTLTSSTGSGFSGTADNAISFTAIDVLDGSGSLSNGEGTASTWIIYASSDNSTYGDGSNTLTFSGFTTLNADNAGDTFVLQSGAAGYTINGGTGIDTLMGVSDAVLSSSNTSGFSGTADNTISFTAIDVLDGAGSLTGENVASTWTLGSPSTYYDGSNTLDFSGFGALNGSGADTLAGATNATLTGSSVGYSGNAETGSGAGSGLLFVTGATGVEEYTTSGTDLGTFVSTRVMSSVTCVSVPMAISM